MKYDIKERDSVTFVKLLDDRLIYESLDPIQQKFTDLVEAGARKIVLNMEDVTYLDSFAVGFIMDMYRRVTSAGGKFKLCGLQPRVKKVLSITRVDNVIDIFPDSDQAFKALTDCGE